MNCVPVFLGNTLKHQIETIPTLVWYLHYSEIPFTSHILNINDILSILCKCGHAMRAIWSFMDLSRSLLLQKIHKTHIARRHRSIFALL